MGWLRPVLILPVSMVTTMSMQNIELILLHELAHIQRGIGQLDDDVDVAPEGAACIGIERANPETEIKGPRVARNTVNQLMVARRCVCSDKNFDECEGA